MFQINVSRKAGLMMFVSVLMVAIFALLVARTQGQSSQPALASARASDTQILAIEIAENGTRFTPDEAPVFEDDGLPAYGSAFITEGYIYPAGTLASSTHGGSMPDGSPEFPDKVIGRWTCWGYHVNNGAHTQPGEGPIIVTTQLFDFGTDYGAETITTIGYEFPDTDEHARAIVGGTGQYSFVGGQQNQAFIAWNDSVGVQLAVEFEVRDLRGYLLSLPLVAGE